MATSHFRYIGAALLGAATLVWTGAGESADPNLRLHELPLGLGECSQRVECPLPTTTAIDWIGRTPRGHLFVVSAPCADRDAECASWIVEKTPAQVSVLLGVNGPFELRKNARSYPEVILREAVSAQEINTVQFSWRDGAYVEGEARAEYLVDGVACGTRTECNETARAALATSPSRSLKIWEQVHGVNWY